MGLGFSQEGQMQQLYEFRTLATDQENFEIPEKPENRRVTDRKYLIAFVVVLVLLFPFLIYTLMNLQLHQLSGSDNCGNFCGYVNEKYDEWACTGKNYTDKPYLKLGNIVATDENFEMVLRNRECVKECPPGYKPTFRTCLPTDKGMDANQSFEAIIAFFGEVGHDIAKGWWAIIVSILVTVLLCMGTLSLFRFAVDFVVWFVLVGSIGVLAIAAGLLWYAYFKFKDEPMREQREVNDQGAVGFLVLAAMFSIIVLCLIIVITCMVKKVKLIIAMFKETSKAIFDVPSLIFMPIWTSILISIVFLIFITIAFFMFLCGKLTEVIPNYLEYQGNGVMIFTMVYNLFLYIWVTEFIAGAQYIVIAGAVSAWFFTRNKHYLTNPVSTSLKNFLKFHLGTVAIGSLIIALMRFVRAIVKKMSDNPRTRWMIECCLSNIDELLRFLSKNAYIQTAMHGQPFFKSGKRAAKLLVSNAVNVIAINSIGDFVLGVMQLLLIIASSGAGVFIASLTGTKHYWAIAVICTAIALCMAISFFSIFESTIDCIFICFCEDTTLNDGMARPYFMSKGLMQFIEDSKAVYPAKV